MKIDWKKVSQSEGYIKLKTALLINERCHLKDKRYLEHFKWAIARAKHYSYHTGRPLEDILLEWELGRTYSALNYYSDCNFPKLTKGNCLKCIGVTGLIKSNSKWNFESDSALKNRNMRDINESNQKKSTKLKKRWDSKRKKRQKDYVAYLARKSNQKL